VAQVASAAPLARSPDAVRAERRAWLVIWLAFATFCLLLASAVKYLVDYVTTAEIDLVAGVEVPRGTIFVQTPGGPKYQLAASELAVGTVIEPSRGSNPPASVRLHLFDDSRVIAEAGSALELVRMDVGRFINQRTIMLRQTDGPVHYQADGEIHVQVPNGMVRMHDADTTVWVDGDRTTVLVYSGAAHVESGSSSADIDTDQRAEFGVDHVITRGDRAEQLLPDGDFADQDDSWQPHDDQNGPKDVAGVRDLNTQLVDGVSMPVLRITRNSVTQAHGETGLEQKLNIPVSGYRHLWLDAWIRVDHQSLSGGGQLGSEYPMMFALEYEGTQEGSAPNWYHGFYAANPEGLRVDQGQEVPLGEWINYRIDLMTQEDLRKPYRITKLTVMGQGHSYDARVANIRLIGE
jgi:hypothetical protein